MRELLDSELSEEELKKNQDLRKLWENENPDEVDDDDGPEVLARYGYRTFLAHLEVPGLWPNRQVLCS